VVTASSSLCESAQLGENAIVPESLERAAERKTLTREAVRRRAAVDTLRIGESMCGYAAAQLANGLSPAAARRAALDVAGELELMAVELRRLTRLRPDERRGLAVQLAALGLPTRRIAAVVGVSDRSVRYYVRGRASAGESPQVG
jgi:hypothetical protein